MPQWTEQNNAPINTGADAEAATLAQHSSMQKTFIYYLPFSLLATLSSQQKANFVYENNSHEKSIQSYVKQFCTWLAQLRCEQNWAHASIRFTPEVK